MYLRIIQLAEIEEKNSIHLTSKNNEIWNVLLHKCYVLVEYNILHCITWKFKLKFKFMLGKSNCELKTVCNALHAGISCTWNISVCIFYIYTISNLYISAHARLSTCMSPDQTPEISIAAENFYLIITAITSLL